MLCLHDVVNSNVRSREIIGGGGGGAVGLNSKYDLT